MYKAKSLFTVTLLCLVCLQAFAQKKQVKVSVSDALGPLAGAGVLVQGTSLGTVTDSDGVATVNIDENGVVEVSMIGYTTQAIPVAGKSLEFHESGMVTFPLLGTEADLSEKIAFDPDRRKRHVIYPEVVSIFHSYSVFVGGSSSFDITPQKYNKYDAMVKYGKENGYSVDEMLYVGDDFGDGGGDSHIRLGGMDYFEIDDYRNSPSALEFLL